MDWKSLTSKAAPVVVNVRVELPYGGNEQPRTVDVPISTLSYGRWMKAESMVPEPAVPRTLAGPGGTKQPNLSDVTYKAALADAHEKRAYIRLAMSLQDAGMDIPGESLEEQAAAIRDSLDAGVANALLMFLATAAMNGKAQAESAADGFRGSGG
jgi:hypothetical protein